MARPFKLKPRQIGDRGVLDIPAVLSDTGARQRPYFKTLEAARLKASEIRARKHNFRVAVDSFRKFSSMTHCVQLSWFILLIRRQRFFMPRNYSLMLMLRRLAVLHLPNSLIFISNSKTTGRKFI